MITTQIDFTDCIAACNTCADACDHCTASCLCEEDIQPMAKCIALDIDCARICRLAASFMASGSEYAVEVCDLCAEICERCADECANHEQTHCQECADACRQCAEACRNM